VAEIAEQKADGPDAASPIVDVAWIASRQADTSVRLVELDVSGAAYNAGHIPGAILWNAYSDLRDQHYKPIGTAELEALLCRSGITPGSTLVFYGYGAALGFWLMSAHGHNDVRMLVGPREQWVQAGEAWSTDVPSPSPSAYPLAAANAKAISSRADAQAAIGDPGIVLLDVRSEGEFSGERFWPSGATADTGRAGHAPGAVSVPIDLLLDDDGSFRGADELRRALETAGVTPAQTVITYCTIGNRASQAAFALRYLLGYPDVRVYYASWVDWGKTDGMPIEP